MGEYEASLKKLFVVDTFQVTNMLPPKFFFQQCKGKKSIFLFIHFYLLSDRNMTTNQQFLKDGLNDFFLKCWRMKLRNNFILIVVTFGNI